MIKFKNFWDFFRDWNQTLSQKIDDQDQTFENFEKILKQKYRNKIQNHGNLNVKNISLETFTIKAVIHFTQNRM